MPRFSHLVLALTVSLPAATAFAQDAPAEEPADEEVTTTAFVQAKADEIISIINRSTSSPAEADQRREDLRASIRAFLDFEVLARRTLGDHWDARTPEQREAFVSLLRELIETSYTRRLGSDSITPDSYTVEYQGERSRNNRTVVESTITHDGNEYLVEIKVMEEDDGTRVIYDVVTDDVSLEESYAESFDNIITEDGWDELMNRMQERLDELNED